MLNLLLAYLLTWTQETADMISRNKRSLSVISTTRDTGEPPRKEPRVEFDANRLRDSNEAASYTLPPASSAVRLLWSLLRCLITG